MVENHVEDMMEICFWGCFCLLQLLVSQWSVRLDFGRCTILCFVTFCLCTPTFQTQDLKKKYKNFSFFLNYRCFHSGFFRHKLSQQVVKTGGWCTYWKVHRHWMCTRGLKSPLDHDRLPNLWCHKILLICTRNPPPLLSDECENKPLMSNSAHTSFCTVRRSNRKQNTFLSCRGGVLFSLPSPLCCSEDARKEEEGLNNEASHQPWQQYVMW